MRTRRVGSFAILTLLAFTGAEAQTSRYYLTAGDQQNVSVVQGGTLVNSWTQANNQCCLGEYAVAVLGDVRTLANGNPPHTGVGSQYTLGGLYTGTTYPYPVADASFYDGGTDGTHNFSVDYLTGNVWSMDRDWANASLLFSTGFSGELGITWDASTNTLWTLNYYDGAVHNWTLGGSFLGGFNTGLSFAGSLAMDYADGSLWLTSQTAFGTLYQYSTSGTFTGLSEGIAGYNYLGGEFDVAEAAVPEPASLALLASGLSVLVPMARRRARRR
jgi:hypothetical protein